MGLKIKKNGKVINLSESDLRRITMKVLKEQEEAEAAVAGGDEAALEAELDEIDEENPDPQKVNSIFDKLENFMAKAGDLPKKLQRFKRKISKMFKKHGNSAKYKKLSMSCPKW